MNTYAQSAATELLQRHHELSQPRVFKLLGHEWDHVPGVYAPDLTQSAALYAEWIPYPVGGAFCEVGCGTGYIAVTAALRGCERVAAIDINPAAAENTRLNAKRHGVADRVQAVCGDMFSSLGAEDRYDVIFWNSNFIEAPAPRGEASMLDRAFFDPGYQAHEAYLRDAARHLHPGGKLLLGFTDLGNVESIARLARRHGWKPRLARAVRCEAAQGPIQYQLIQFDPA